MKKNLYIDFDGVILDTIVPMYDLIKKKDSELYKRSIKKNNIVNDEDNTKIRNIINGIEWDNFLKVTPQINDSIKNINYLIKTKKFDISILTHVNSYHEMEAKFDFISKNIKGEIDIICVPKRFAKTIATQNCKDAILVDDHSGNLRDWTKEGGISIKFSKEKRDHPEFVCISSLAEIDALF